MADAAVWITGSGPDKQLNFRLPTGGKGDKGDKGDKGADGANVLPTDTAIAAAVNNGASATKAALNATYLPGDFTGATNGQVATWDSVAGKFKPKPAPASGSIAPTMVITGDSTVAGNGGPALGPSTPVTPNRYWSARGPVTWMMPLIKQRLKIISNAGIGGQRADQVQARFAADVVAYSPGWVLIQVGTNDVSQGRTAAQIQTSLTAMYDAAKAAGIRVLANTITTQRSFAGATTVGALSIGGTSINVSSNAGTPEVPSSIVGDSLTIDTGANAETVTVSAVAGAVLTVSALTKAHASGALIVNNTKMGVLATVNAWLRSYALANPNLILADINAAYTDPATGGPVASLTIDGTHMSIDGGAALGKVQADALDRALNPQPYGAVNGFANMLTNGQLNGTAGAFAGFGAGKTSGTLPDGWTLYGNTNATVAASRVNRSDGIPGQWLQLAITGNTGSLDFGPANITTGWAVGDQIWIEAEVQMDPDVVPPAGTGPLQNITVNTPGGSGTDVPNAFQAASGTDGSSTYWIADGVIRTNVGVIAAGTTSLQPRISFNIASGTVRIGRARLVKGTI